MAKFGHEQKKKKKKNNNHDKNNRTNDKGTGVDPQQEKRFKKT